MSTVLVADDDVGVRTLIRTVLEDEGHRILEAASAVEVFESVDVERPDVILLDVHLGGDDGLAIGMGLRRERLYQHIKIIFMTGTFDEPELVRQSRRFKADIMEKPLDLGALIAAVR